MTRNIVLSNLAELDRYRDEFATDQCPVQLDAVVPDLSSDADPDVLSQAIDRAATELQRLNDLDASARLEAEGVLAHYRRLEADAEQLRKLAAEACAVAAGAGRLRERAFLLENLLAADHLATGAATVATIVKNRLDALSAQMAMLAERDDLARLLAEERAVEVARQREQRVRSAIQRAEALASEHKLNEALRLLGSLVKANPNMPAVASSYETIARRAQAVKTLEVERVLAEARRLHRHEPGRAAEILGPLDLSQMPAVLVRDVYGCWIHSCRRLGLEDAVHYSPGSGRGAVLVPDSDGRLKVVAAIGLSGWAPGRCFVAKALKGARPLG